MTDTWTSLKLSASSNGRNVKIAATPSTGTLLHTPSATSGVTDFMYVDACNTSASDVTLTLQFGGVTSTDDHIEIIMTGKNGWERIVSGLPLEAAKQLHAFAGTTNVINCNGFIHRLTVT